jgi:gamma-glutamylcyclotransferase (GGCT)/AIG2-like uncharacterized protein YtfP
MLVFMYGTLMCGFGNNRLLQAKGLGDEAVRPAILLGPARTVSRFEMIDVGFPYIKQNTRKGHPVLGELWDIGESKQMLERLDALEGVNHKQPNRGHYRRNEHNVRLEGHNKPSQTAWLYEATDATWERAQWRDKVLPNENGVLSWGDIHKARRGVR